MTGFICLDKPADMTSFLAVAKVRRIVGEKKAGHSGTLDPLATGVLPIMLGGATRFLDFLPSNRKSYIAGVKLGMTSDTLDITGKILSENEARASEITLEDIASVSQNFLGEIMQVPPMYSAIKKDGVRMYELARKGIEVERKPRQVTIYNLDASKGEGENEYVLSVECSSGTYIRTLIDDIGQRLGCGAIMTSLQRTSSQGFEIKDAITLEELEESQKNGSLETHIIPVFNALSDYEILKVSAGQSVRFSNGGGLDLDRIKGCKHDGLYRVVSPEDKFLGLGYADTQLRTLAVKRVYVGR